MHTKGKTETMAIKPQPVTQAERDRVDNAANAQPQHVDDDTLDAPMVEQAAAIADTANVDSVVAIIQGIGKGMNTEKAKLAVALLNVTNYAVGLQGRSAWNTRDFMSYGIALASLSQIDAADPSRSGSGIAPRIDMDKLAAAIGQG